MSFSIKNVRSFPSIRKLPQNIQGQYTNNDGMRYYPTLWILADIDFKYIEMNDVKSDFKFNTRYPPHISLACVAVQLDVNKVGQLENNITQCQKPHTIQQKHRNYNHKKQSDEAIESINSTNSIPPQTSIDIDTHSNIHSNRNSHSNITCSTGNHEGASNGDEESGEEYKEGYDEATKTK